MNLDLAGRTQTLYFDALIDEASRLGVPIWLANDAARITARRLRESTDSATSPRIRSRTRAYFWGVIRNTCFESSDRRLDSLRARYVHASIHEDARMAELDRVTGTPEGLDTVSVQLELALA